jgi:hypothetical protein
VATLVALTAAAPAAAAAGCCWPVPAPIPRTPVGCVVAALLLVPMLEGGALLADEGSCSLPWGLMAPPQGTAERTGRVSYTV